MDLFFFDKAEQKKSIPFPRCNLLQFIAKFFRFLELCFVLLFLFWSISRLPIAVRISAEYSAKLFAFLATPLFGFLLCNAIIVALVAKPSQFSGLTAVSDESDRIYENLIDGGDVPKSEDNKEEEVVFQDKQIIGEAVSSIDREVAVEVKIADTDTDQDPDLETELGFGHPKVILRTFSEKLKAKTQSEKLRRSATEMCRNLEHSHSHEILYFQDDLSSEEFQRKIEEFIAKEKRFRREESSAIVLLHCDGLSSL